MSAARSRVVMVATDGFAELVETRRLLLAAGVEVLVASLDLRPIQGVEFERGASLSRTIEPDLALDGLDAASFDALVLPGGVRSPDTLRTSATAVGLVRSFVDRGKLVAAICHAPWLLIEARVVKGRRVTGWSSIRTDLLNAGGDVVDEPVVVDGNIITSRMPDDIAEFGQAVVTALATRRAAVPR